MGKIRARADNEKLFFDFTYLDCAAASRPRCLIRLLTGKSWRRSLSA